jgi:nitroimidazol reductase NimA-like FMN-containing flavoprotein (pyridoxamine 5'-phosphate oxidase superfamily)
VDRELRDDTKIVDLLQHAQIGFTATAVDGQPYLNSNLFWFDEVNKRIYFHTAIEGRTRSNIEANPQVCFGIAEIGSLLPADTALEFSTEYAGVIAFGRGRVVDNPQEAERGLYGLLQKYFPNLKPGSDYRNITAEELERTSVFAIDIESWSGKQKKSP